MSFIQCCRDVAGGNFWDREFLRMAAAENSQRLHILVSYARTRQENSSCNKHTVFRCWSRRSAELTRQMPPRDCLTNSLHGASTLCSLRLCSLFACSLFIEDMAKMRFTVVSQRWFLTTQAINSFCRVHFRGHENYTLSSFNDVTLRFSQNSCQVGHRKECLLYIFVLF